MTDIQWTDYSVNPGIFGCQFESPTCTSCYAMRMAHRQVAMGNYPEGITKVTRAGVVWTGLVETDESKISPAFRKLPKTKPARVFVTSMADLFHADVPDRFIDATFDEMIARPHLTFQVLTKRIERVPRWYEARRHAMKWPDNVWMGATVEDQRRADERIPHLLRVPARTRFLSCEALLGPIDLGSAIGYTCAGGDGSGCGWFGAGEDATGEDWVCPECGGETVPVQDSAGGDGVESPIHWLITGGESGPNPRPSDVAWFRSLRDQCAAANVPFFMKQLGSHGRMHGKDRPGGELASLPEDLRVREFPRG